MNPGAPSADGQQYITSRSLLQSSVGPSYWTVTIHAAAANAEAVRAEVAQLAAMPAPQLASVLRSHGEVLRFLLRTHLPVRLGRHPSRVRWSILEMVRDIRCDLVPARGVQKNTYLEP